MDEYEDPLARIGLTLACAVIGQIVSVVLAALLASTLEGGYRVRAWSFLALVVWTLAGTVVLVLQTLRAEPGPAAARRSGLTNLAPRRIALWIVSSWVWPILVRWRPRQ
jgi:hypothetical protein